MKFLEGKNPAEKKKLIAAMILGALAFLVVGYNFYGMFFAGKPKTTTTAKSNSNSNTSSNSNTNNNSNATTVQVLEPIPSLENINDNYIVTPVFYNPESFFGPIGSRNIFAFYEPPPPTPFVPTPIPPPVIKTPTPEKPTPTPPPPPQANVMLGFMSPQSVYAGSKSFLLELNGTNFLPETYIFINGMQIPTNYVNGQKLTANIDQSMIASAGTFNIEVKSVDGKWFSNPMTFNVQQPPLPDYEYVGLISRQRANNDTAYLMAKGAKEPIGVRLNDTVGGRFRVISISNREIILKDKELGFEYRKPLYRITQSGGKPSSGTSTGGTQPNNGFPPGIQPMNPQIGPNGQPCPPGIPCNPSQPIYRPPQQNEKKQEIDEDDEDGDE